MKNTNGSISRSTGKKKSSQGRGGKSISKKKNDFVIVVGQSLLSSIPAPHEI
jgi:hypothetical protein